MEVIAREFDGNIAHGYFGVCPACHAEPEFLNIGADHYAVCTKHKLYWCVGSNLFDEWHDENAAIWVCNQCRLDAYTPAEAHYVAPERSPHAPEPPDMDDDA